MINKAGYKIIVVNGIVFICLLTFIHFQESVLLDIITLITCILFIFHFFFFRDPERKIPPYENLIISPADGKVIKISEVEEDQYLHKRAILVSIFMSIFDVHVNRIPVTGEIEYLKYRSGKFKPAYQDNSSELNEQLATGINSSYGKILMKQIAGIIARRIVCFLEKGSMVKVGERFGMIKYGSRVDLFIPMTSELSIKLFDQVKAGETIIGKLPESRIR